MKTTVKVLLATQKQLANGEYPITIRLTKNRSSKYVSLGLSCKAEHWDEKAGQVKSRHPLYSEISATISRRKLEIQREVLQLVDQKGDFSWKELKTLYPESNGKVYVLAYFDQVEERLLSSGRVGYSKVFRFTANSLRTFRKGEDFSFHDVNTSFLMRYEEWFLSRGVKLNSIFVFMRTFKTLINYARKEELVKSDFHPFKEFSFSKYRRVKSDKRAITKEQIQQIQHYQAEPGTPLFHAKSYFLFSYYCRGINFTDIAFLKWSSVRDNRIEYVRRKTHERFSVNLLEPAVAIIAYYRDNHYQGESGYVFPILKIGVHTTPVQIDNSIEKVIKQVNKALKEIAKQLGINQRLTTYVARHSFATVLKKNGVSIAVISELMGHDSEQTTRIYLQSFGDQVLDAAAQEILS